MSFVQSNRYEFFSTDFDSPLSLDGKLAQGYNTFQPFEYVAALYYNDLLFCSGVLISRKHVLTVAICLKKFVNDVDIKFWNYHALLGTDSLDASRLNYLFQEVKVPKQYNYVDEDLPHNIGIVTVRIINNIFTCYELRVCVGVIGYLKNNF